MDIANITAFPNSRIASVIDEYVNGQHAERNRAILKRRLIDGICFEPLAEEFDMSPRQIQNILYRHKDRIIAHL
jgi:hypothetical protein